VIDIRAHLSRLLNAHYGASCPAHDPAYLAGCALMQALPAGERVTAAEATKKAQARFSALVEPLAVWAGRRRRNIRRHLLQPWTWFDNSRAADIASNILMGPWINLGIWGYPVWQTQRDLGK